MGMTPNTRKAAEALKRLGVIIVEWDDARDNSNGDTYSGRAFLFATKSYEGDERFADYNGQYLKELCVEDEYINPFHIREDVHRILAIYKLATEWDNPGQVMVYDDPEASGVRHWEEWVKRRGKRDNRPKR